MDVKSFGNLESICKMSLEDFKDLASACKNEHIPEYKELLWTFFSSLHETENSSFSFDLNRVDNVFLLNMDSSIKDFNGELKDLDGTSFHMPEFNLNRFKACAAILDDAHNKGLYSNKFYCDAVNCSLLDCFVHYVVEDVKETGNMQDPEAWKKAAANLQNVPFVSSVVEIYNKLENESKKKDNSIERDVLKKAVNDMIYDPDFFKTYSRFVNKPYCVDEIVSKASKRERMERKAEGSLGKGALRDYGAFTRNVHYAMNDFKDKMVANEIFMAADEVGKEYAEKMYSVSDSIDHLPVGSVEREKGMATFVLKAIPFHAAENIKSFFWFYDDKDKQKFAENCDYLSLDDLWGDKGKDTIRAIVKKMIEPYKGEYSFEDARLLLKDGIHKKILIGFCKGFVNMTRRLERGWQLI